MREGGYRDHGLSNGAATEPTKEHGAATFEGLIAQPLAAGPQARLEGGRGIPKIQAASQPSACIFGDPTPTLARATRAQRQTGESVISNQRPPFPPLAPCLRVEIRDLELSFKLDLLSSIS